MSNESLKAMSDRLILEDILARLKEQEKPQGFVQSIKEAVRGKNQFDYPETADVISGQDMPAPRSPTGIGNRNGFFGAPDVDSPYNVAANNRARQLRAVDLPRSTEGKLSALRKQFPQATFGADSYGNVFMENDGQRSYINRAGISGQDGRDILADAAFEAPLAIGGARLAAPVLGRATGGIIGTGAGAAAGSVARDAVAKTAGSDAKIDTGNAVTAGIFGAGFETFGQLANSALKIIIPKIKNAGVISSNDRMVLERIGIDPDSVTPQFIEEYMRQVPLSTNPEAAANKALAESLPEPVPLSSGQLSGDPGQLYLEGQMRKRGGLVGDNPLLAQQEAADAALLKNKDVLQDRLGAGISSDAEAARMIQDRIVKRSAAADRLTSRKYNKARELSTPETGIGGQPALDMFTSIKGVYDDLLFDRNITPRAAKLLDNFEGMVTDKSGFVKASDLHNWRKQANKIFGTSSSKEEKAAIRIILSAYDKAERDAIDKALFSGNEDAIAAWRDAIKTNAEKMRMFNSEDVVSKLVARTKDGTGNLSVSPDDAVDYIFGRGTLGNRNNLARDFGKLKTVLGEGSREWKALKEAAFLRLFRDQTEGSFSGAKFTKNLNSFLLKGDAAKAVFTQDEVNMFKQLAAVARAAERRPKIKGDPNPSGTGITNWVNNAVLPLMDRFGAIGQGARVAAGWALGRFQPVMDSEFNRSAVRAAIPKRELVPLGVTGAAGLPLLGND